MFNRAISCQIRHLTALLILPACMGLFLLLAGCTPSLEKVDQFHEKILPYAQSIEAHQLDTNFYSSPNTPLQFLTFYSLEQAPDYHNAVCIPVELVNTPLDEMPEQSYQLSKEYFYFQPKGQPYPAIQGTHWYGNLRVWRSGTGPNFWQRQEVRQHRNAIESIRYLVLIRTDDWAMQVETEPGQPTTLGHDAPGYWGGRVFVFDLEAEKYLGSKPLSGSVADRPGPWWNRHRKSNRNSDYRMRRGIEEQLEWALNGEFYYPR